MNPWVIESECVNQESNRQLLWIIRFYIQLKENWLIEIKMIVCSSKMSLQTISFVVQP